MRREASPVRPDFADHAREIGFEYARADGEVYWDESLRYVFSLSQIETIENATEDLAKLMLDVAERIIADDLLLKRLGIPAEALPVMRRSWQQREPSLYGRFDFAYDGTGHPKLLEYNADTPTSLYEAAVVQWLWLEQMTARGLLPAGTDQFNSLHERLVERWRGVALSRPLHLACQMESVEDRVTTAYLAECASQAGLATKSIDIGDIGLNSGRFYDREGQPIEQIFKLYPWEWMFADAFGPLIGGSATRFIEPPWKLALSNKGILPILWEMAPEHPNLLEAYFDSDPARSRLGERYVTKPIFSREGADITIHDQGRVVVGPKAGYDKGKLIWQQLAPLPEFDSCYPVIGSWVIGQSAAGMGIREDRSPITTNQARFVPHVILG